MTDYVVTGLTKRRAEITGEIGSLHERLNGVVRWQPGPGQFVLWEVAR